MKCIWYDKYGFHFISIFVFETKNEKKTNEKLKNELYEWISAMPSVAYLRWKCGRKELNNCK